MGADPPLTAAEDSTVFLYELAITLDKRSPELIEVAAALGMGELQPATELDAQQVAALRAHVSGGAVPPPLAPLGSGTPPLPAAPSGPLVAAPPTPFGGFPPPPDAPPPPSVDGSPAPRAPASWGPPVPGIAPAAAPVVAEPPTAPSPAWASGTAPATWAPPGEAPPAPPAAAPQGWGAPSAPPEAWGAPTPPTSPTPTTAPPGPGPAHAGPHFAYPEGSAAPPAPPVPPAFAATLPPPPDPGSPGGPPHPASGGSGIGTGQKVAIAAVVVLVVALFGYMALNTGPDEERERAIAESEAKLEATMNETTLPKATSSTAVPTTAAPAPDVNEPVDLARFCQGGLAAATFELRLVAAMADQDFAELSALVRDRRQAWSDDLGTLASGAPPILVNDIELYRGGYDVFFDAVESSSSFEEVFTKVDRMDLARAGNAGKEWGTQVTFECE